MKLNNVELINIHNVLQALAQQKIAGAFKFKLLKLTKAVGEEARTVIESLEFKEDGKVKESEENEEILKVEQDVSLPRINEKDLEPLEISVADLLVLEPIIDKGDDK